MRKLKIKLKQHTPLIHFQYDQEGATLRASEVKPKLDRYILSKLGEKYYNEISDDEFDEVVSIFEKKETKKKFDEIGIKAQEFEVGIYVARKKKWIVSTNGNALNYKMRIQTDNSSSRTDFMLASFINYNTIQRLQDRGIKPISNSPFFAQEKENRDIINSDSPVYEWNKIGKKGVLENGTIHVTLLCINKDIERELFDFLSTFIQSFFISTNFGTRQSKGFGSFTVNYIEYEGKQIQLASNEFLLKKNFLFVYKNNREYRGKEYNRLSKIFSTINDDYKLLKSGRRGTDYNRSKVMLYADDDNKKWEKRLIKRKFNAIPKNPYSLKSEHNNQPKYKKDEEYLYYRALLGLAEQFEFLLYNPPARNSKMVVKVSPNSSEIQRYQSPLLFKVIDNSIYIVGNEVCSDMLGKTFNFHISIQKDTNHIKDDFPIKTPSTFNLKDFMCFAMEDNSDYTKLK